MTIESKFLHVSIAQRKIHIANHFQRNKIDEEKSSGNRRREIIKKRPRFKTLNRQSIGYCIWSKSIDTHTMAEL